MCWFWHDWGKWVDAKVTLLSWVSEQWETKEGQERYCKICGLKQVREIL